MLFVTAPEKYGRHNCKANFMCGIAGYKSLRPVGESVLDEMLHALIHRGPDSVGYHRTEGYTGGVRRLSINDLSGGNQPLFNEDRSVVLFYNGEIYNSPQLRRELEASNHRFRTRSDGEVICHMYARYGERLFERLDGMFAAALWVESEKKLILARDIPGEKPLYFARLSETELAFASEIRSLVRFPGLDLSFDEQAMWDFPTFLWVPEPRTIYRKIEALERSHLLIADPRGIRIEKYTNRFNTQTIELNDKTVVDETRRVVTEAVQSRLLSDVPVGCFLSSGLDTSIVATLAARALPELSTFTVGFEDTGDASNDCTSEAEDARRYAASLGTEHHTIRLTPGDFRSSLSDFFNYGDQPFAVSSALGVLAVAKVARESGIKVLLSGDGADESFGGYSWYTHLPTVSSGRITSGRDQATDASFQHRSDVTAVIDAVSQYSPHKRAWAMHYYASESDKLRLYNQEYFQTARVRSSLRHFAEYKSGPEWLAEDYIAHDRNFYFPNEMLQKLDRMTMAHSIEGRAPFAAPSVLSHAGKLEYRHMVRNGTLKWVLRSAFKDILPADVMMRPKHGFNVPVDHWLTSSCIDLVEEAFCRGSALARLGLINKGSEDVARQMLADRSKSHGHTILSFIMLNRWLTTS